MKKQITIAICGCGGRGMYAYASYALSYPEQIKVVAGADINPERINHLKKEHNIAEQNCFSSGEEMFKAPKLADLMVIATQDKQHVEHAMLALEKGYHILLEKPISPDLSECIALQKKAQEKNCMVIVCHVLRYTPFYSKLKELLVNNAIGNLHAVQANENVAYWHFAHSFVRGTWRKKAETSPVIMAKCCHDMDILRWLVDKPCLRVSSYGELSHFKAENAPEGSSLRCLENCAVQKSCPYDAQYIYFDNKKTGMRTNGQGWCNHLTLDITEENVYKALQTGIYGRCVYHCDNDVADHQVVSMEFEGGVSVSFVMSAFTDDCYRTIKLMGSHGEIEGNMEEKQIILRRFGKAEEMIKVDDYLDTMAGHGGGDGKLMQAVYTCLNEENGKMLTSIDASIESHVMALAAEKSRLNKGESIELKAFANGM